MPTRSRLQAFALGLAAFFLPAAAFAASFDCSRPATAHEQVICGDPALSTLDDKLASSYEARRAALSPRGAKLLQASQRSWLRFVRTVCTATPSTSPAASAPTSAPDGAGPAACLVREYWERLGQLEAVGLKSGPYTVLRVDLFSASPEPGGDSGRLKGFSVAHLAYPQIDAPDTPVTREWNAHVAKTLPILGDCEGPSDDTLVYALGLMTAHFVSLTWEEDHYCHGHPHGFFGSTAENLLLQPVQRALAPSDLFGPGQAWVPGFERLVERALQAQAWQPTAPNGLTEVLEASVDPRNWLLTPGGIAIAFSAYTGGCYACTPQALTLPWEDLKPLLAPDAVAP